MKNYDDVLGNERVRAFLALIRKTEGAGYNTLFGGGTFEGYADHPRQRITRKLGGRDLTSTAAGAYQFLARTWDECKPACGLPDFSPTSQDIAAIFLIDRREALEDVLEGDWKSAIAKTNREWASLPGSPYGQPTKALSFCLAYLDAQVAAEAPKPVEPQPALSLVSRIMVMPSFLSALKSGEELVNAAKVKNIQGVSSALAALLIAGAAIARAYGYVLPITDEQLGQIAVLGSTLLLNAWATFATSKRVGINVPTSTGGDGPGVVEPAAERPAPSGWAKDMGIGG
jgi:muramidase (phage lysozyme)